MDRRISRLAAAAAALIALLAPAASLAWGDQGHMVVALVANHYLKPEVRQKVTNPLAGDTTNLTPDHSIASEATWADKYRDSDRNTTHVRYNATHEWHFVDIEISDGDIDSACFGHPALASGTAASDGAARDCVVDKINQFAAELGNPTTSADEKRMALQFLLHFVGDLHQPLHASDDHDQGGNAKKVKADGIATGKLHHYWDAEFVKLLGSSPNTVANKLIATIKPAQIAAWSKGSPETWATQSYDASKLYAYGGLGSASAGKYTLSPSYVTRATNSTARQLGRAGVRLAKILNAALE
jgi:hypothetical protein